MRLKQIERCPVVLGDRTCYTPLWYDTDAIGRVRALCPACAGIVSRPVNYPIFVKPAAGTRTRAPHLTPERRVELATAAYAIGDRNASIQFGVCETVAKKYRLAHFGKKPNRSLQR